MKAAVELSRLNLCRIRESLHVRRAWCAVPLLTLERRWIFSRIESPVAFQVNGRWEVLQ